MRRVDTSPEDLFSGERSPKNLDALSRFGVYRLLSVGPTFDEVYTHLYNTFGVRDELERREVMESWVQESPRQIAGRQIHYALLAAFDETGQLAGMRDSYLCVESGPQPRTTVYLAHTLVLPAYRRSGLSALLRAAPLALAREFSVEDAEYLICAEMEPPDPRDRDSLVRLLAYGRAGFSVIHPQHLPYCQADFRALTEDQAAEPLPLLAVLRRVDNEGQKTLPKMLASAFAEGLLSVFRSHCRPRDIDNLQEAVLASLRAQPEDIPLVSLPQQVSALPMLAALGKSTIAPYYAAVPNARIPEGSDDEAALFAALEHSFLS